MMSDVSIHDLSDANLQKQRASKFALALPDDV